MKQKKFLFIWMVSAGLFLFSQSCTNNQNSSSGTEEKSAEQMTMQVNDEPEFNKAICVLHPTEGNTAKGTVTFTKTDGGIKVVADLEGLSEGKHGFHIHEYGDCSNLDGTSAGGHFNPEGTDHGAPSDDVRHVGDLGNVEAGADGRAHLELTDTEISFSGSHSIIGRGIIVHAGTDDLVSQPTGDAGARVACGVIGIAK